VVGDTDIVRYGCWWRRGGRLFDVIACCRCGRVSPYLPPVGDLTLYTRGGVTHCVAGADYAFVPFDLHVRAFPRRYYIRIWVLPAFGRCFHDVAFVAMIGVGGPVGVVARHPPPPSPLPSHPTYLLPPLFRYIWYIAFGGTFAFVAV